MEKSNLRIIEAIHFKVYFCMFVNCVDCLLQYMVCGRTGVHGVVTSAVEEEPGHEFDRAQTLRPQMAETIVKERHEKRQSVLWHRVQVNYVKLLFYIHELSYCDIT